MPVLAFQHEPVRRFFVSESCCVIYSLILLSHRRLKVLVAVFYLLMKPFSFSHVKGPYLYSPEGGRWMSKNKGGGGKMKRKIE
jgi:hypothetical protein